MNGGTVTNSVYVFIYVRVGRREVGAFLLLISVSEILTKKNSKKIVKLKIET